MPSEKVVCSGLVERIGSDEAVFNYTSDSVQLEETSSIATHRKGLEKIAAVLLHPEKGVIKNSSEIDAVGHRVVHGAIPSLPLP